MKRILSILVCAVLVLNLFPVTSALAETNYVEVTKDSAPIRNDYYETGSVMKWVPRGTVLQVVGTKYNSKFNLWYKVRFDTGYSCADGWIYSGNVKDHQHRYVRYNYNGNTFCVCEKCNTIAIEQVRTVPLSRMESISLAIPTAIGAAMADSPAPGVGDVAAIFILFMAAFEIGTEPQMTEVIEMVNEMDIARFIEEADVCGIESFYKVETYPGGLKKIDNKCMNMLQAFLCVKSKMFNVWTETQEAARNCARLNGSYYGPEKDEGDHPTYYNHYHLGPDKRHKESPRHIFFGTNDYNQRPQ